jgi:ATP-dependent exoDNAse (exonuclease V) beta subunit
LKRRVTVDLDGERWSGTIDVLYRDPAGRLVVADYKTDRDPPEEPSAAYRAQLSVYARAASRHFPDEPEPARELLYVRSGVRQRL